MLTLVATPQHQRPPGKFCHCKLRSSVDLLSESVLQLGHFTQQRLEIHQGYDRHQDVPFQGQIIFHHTDRRHPVISSSSCGIRVASIPADVTKATVSIKRHCFEFFQAETKKRTGNSVCSTAVDHCQPQQLPILPAVHCAPVSPCVTRDGCEVDSHCLKSPLSWERW